MIPDTVTEIGFHAFEDCTNLEEADIPGSVKEIVAYAFKRCRSLKNVTLHEGLRKIGTWAFGDCDNLKNISIPSTVKIIDHYALGFRETSAHDREFYGIPHGTVFRFRIDHDGNEAVRLYLAWHKHPKSWNC